MVDGHGRVRPHWHHLLATLGSLPGEGIEERARRLALPHHQEGLLFPTAGEREDDQPARCPLPVPLPAAYGAWEISGGVHLLSFGDALTTLNGGDDRQAVGTLGFNIAY